jgi:hypothetical protein
MKHFKRDARSWSRTSLEQRLLRSHEARLDVCAKWSADCRSVLDDGGNSDAAIPLEWVGCLGRPTFPLITKTETGGGGAEKP